MMRWGISKFTEAERDKVTTPVVLLFLILAQMPLYSNFHMVSHSQGRS